MIHPRQFVAKVLLLPILVLIGCDSSPLGVLFKEDAEDTYSCRMIDLDQPSGDSSFQTYDEKQAQLAEQIPGFGGAFYDPSTSTLNVYMLDADDRQGAERVLEWFDENSSINADEVALRVQQGMYDYEKLWAWKRQAVPIFGVDGVNSLGIKESKNRLRIGVSSDAARKCVAKNIGASGIPLEAVLIEHTEPEQER